MHHTQPEQRGACSLSLSLSLAASLSQACDPTPDTRHLHPLLPWSRGPAGAATHAAVHLIIVTLTARLESRECESARKGEGIACCSTRSEEALTGEANSRWISGHKASFCLLVSTEMTLDRQSSQVQLHELIKY